MSERNVTIKLGIEDAIGNRLLEIRKQRDALLARPNIKLGIDSDGISQAQGAMAQTRANAVAATRDMSLLGDAITSKAVAPMAQYSALLGAVLLVTQKLGPGLVTALQRSNVEFTRQRDLMRFWGTSGYLSIGIDHFKSNLAGFVSTSGSGFTKWLQNTSVALSQYRTGLVAGAAAMIGVASAAALSSAGAQRYIESVFGTRLMYKKLGEGSVMDSAKTWVQAAQETPWSAGREARMGTFQTLLSKNPYLQQEQGKEMTEGLEKFFFANSEMLKKAGIGSAEALASAVSAQTMSGENAVVFRDIFGLGFETWTPKTRLTAITQEAGKLDMGQVVEERPEQALEFKLSKSLQGLGDVTLGPMTVVLNTLLKIAEAAGKIPHLPQIVGWGIVLTGMAAAGLTVLSVLAGLVGPLGMLIGLIKGAHLATVAFTAAQWLLNVALTANPVGVVIVAIVALIGVLYLLEKKFGVVTKAWNALKAGMSSLGGAFKDAGGMGVLKIAVDAMVANNPMLKLTLFVVDFLKKVWQNSETLNKLLSSGVTIWQQIGQFFSWLQNGLNGILAALAGIKDSIVQKIGGAMDKLGLGATTTESGSLAPTAANKEKVIGELKAKKFDNGKKVFDFSDELWEMIAEEALTGEPQQYPAMAEPGKLERARNAAKQYVNNPNAYPGAITAVAAGLIDNPTGPLPTKEEKKAWERGEWTGGGGGEMKNGIWVPAMASGGTITGSGSIIGHAGEEVSPASAVVGAKTTLERMSEAAEGGQGGSITVGGTIINLHVDRIDSDIDLEKALAKAGDEFDRLLMFKLRNLLDSGSLRGIGYLRG